MHERAIPRGRHSFYTRRQALSTATLSLAGIALSSCTPQSPVIAEPVAIDLFEAGTEGFANYRIPGIIATAKGVLVAYAEARKPGRGDWAAIDLMLRRSTDGGKTWSAPRMVGQVTGDLKKNPMALAQNLGAEGEITYNNPLSIAGRQPGVLHFIYCIEYMRAFYMRSDDDGETFSQPVEITTAFDAFRPEYDWKVLATGPGHGIELRNGRLVVPVWLSTGTGGHAHRPSVVATIYSDDHGATWHRGEIAIPNTEEWVNPSETAVVQLADGSVMLNARSESTQHRRLITVSADGATAWSRPRFQPELVEPICFGSIVRLSGAGDGRPNRLLFVNPDNLASGDAEGQPGKSRDRKNLTVYLSEDDGTTWSTRRVIDRGGAGYADITVGPDGTIHCFYERAGEAGNAYRPAVLRLVSFDLAWLTQGKHRLEPVR
jgi:sialidase-1